MLANLINGKKIAQDIQEELKLKVAALQSQSKRVPGLAVIRVGEDPASVFYVNKKESTCQELGYASFKSVLAENTSKEELLKVINDYNTNPNIDGILLQLPLPKHLRSFTQDILDQIDPSKDVDGLTTYNLGKLVTNPDQAIWPCTPKGCIELLKRHNINVQGKSTIMIGRSTLVGKPLSLILNYLNASVTMAHSKTLNLADEISKADLVVAAIGVPEFIKGDWIKENAIVLDVGINSILDNEGNKKILGDVEFSEASKRASLITPVPGGVGPMTVAMLLQNCYELYLKKNT